MDSLERTFLRPRQVRYRLRYVPTVKDLCEIFLCVHPKGRRAISRKDSASACSFGGKV